MKRRHAALLAIALVPAAIAADGARYPVAPPESATFVADATGTHPYASAGMILSIDPATGKFRTAPAQATADLQAILGDAISTSSEGLVEEKSRVQGGGTMVNLQGRFQNAMTMAIDANGNVSAPCITGTPAETKTPGEVK
jgi:hypothetical protein